MSFHLRKLTFLHVLLIVLSIGALVRIAELGTAIAQTAPEKTEKVDAKGADDKPENDAPAGDAAPDEPAVKDAREPDDRALNKSDYGVLQQLSDRRKQLDDREKQLDQREALLKAARAEIAEKYKELDAVRAEIKTLLGQQSEAEEAKLQSLVKVYEGMKPADAANILNTLETDVLMQVMDRMSVRKLSPILAQMDPEVARAVTIRLAKQRQLPAAGADATPAASAVDRAQTPPTAAPASASGGTVPMPPQP